MNINISKISLCIQKKMDEFDNFLDRKITEIFFINVQNKCVQTNDRYNNCCNRCLNYHYRCNNEKKDKVVYNNNLVVNQPSSIDYINIMDLDDLEAGFLSNHNLFYPVLDNKKSVKNPLTYGTCVKDPNNKNLDNVESSSNTTEDESDNEESDNDFDNNSNEICNEELDNSLKCDVNDSIDNDYSSNDEYDKLEDYDHYEDYDKIDDDIYDDTDDEIIGILNDKKDD